MTVTVRLAQPQHLSDIVAFAKELLQRTNYQEFPFNAVVARRTVKNAMTDKDSRVWITQRDGKIAGLLIGEIGHMPFTHFLAATDLAFIADAGGELLLDAFVQWCKLRGVARIDMGISAGVNRKGVDRLFRRHGFERSGGMYHMNRINETSGASK